MTEAYLDNILVLVAIELSTNKNIYVFHSVLETEIPKMGGVMQAPWGFS